MNKRICILTLALGAGFALPAVAQLHAAQGNTPSAMKSNPAAAPAPSLPDAAKVVSKADAEAFAAAEFSYADIDKNLKLTRAEFEAFDRARKEKDAEKAMNDAAPAGVTPPSAASTPAPALETAPAGKGADAQYADIAGKAAAIDRKMFVGARLASFATADADANGLLSSSESAKFADLVAGKTAL